MKKIVSLIALVLVGLASVAQTLNVRVGSVTYQFPAAQSGNMTFTGGTTLTIMDKAFTLSEVDEMYIDDSEVVDNSVAVVYDGTSAAVKIAGNVAYYIDAAVSGAFVSIEQSILLDENVGEVTYSLSGSSTDGQFMMDGEYKATVELNSLSLTNATGCPAVHIKNGKRIDLVVNGTNTLSDAAGGSHKATLHVKGHTEMKGAGTLNITGLTSHAFKGNEYVLLKNSFTGSLVVTSAAGDGIHVDQYFEQRSGTVSISGTGDDAIQVDFEVDDAGNVETDEENTGKAIISGGTLTISTSNDAAKGIKAEGDVEISGGVVSVTQTGGIVVEEDDISYPAAIKSSGNITVSGGSVTVKSTAAGGRGLNADGAITINEENASTTVDITANGTGGTAETSSSSTPTTTASYRVYVSLPTGGWSGMGGPGGGSTNNAWKNVYLYNSSGTQVAQLTSTVTKTYNNQSLTFYYYDFGSATTGTYYFKSDNYTSSSRGSSTTYAIQSATFSAPTSGSDIYYSISNSYSTSGSTRTYQLSNVTSTYGGTTDASEDNGTAYNAAGIKADGNVTISAGTVKVGNSGTMSKGIKSKATVSITGGTVTLTPTGGMQVINSDASYSAGIKTVDYVQSGGSVTITCSSGAAIRGISATNVTTDGGTLSITSSSGGQSGSSDNYTAKGIKADTKIALNAGTITIRMTGSGGKGIKCSGTYTQGLADGTGPTLTVSTTGSSFGSSSSSGGGMWGGMESSGGSSAKAIKVLGTVYVYGGQTEVSTATDGAEGLESKTEVHILGGKHYFYCYDDCINGSNTYGSGKLFFEGGVTVCWSYGNDAIDSNAGQKGAITIGDGAVFGYTTRGAPEEGFDCDNNSYIAVTGNGYGISAGANQGGGMGGSSSSSLSGAVQGYYLYTGTISYASGRYYTVADASGNNLITYSFPGLSGTLSSSLSFFTAKGMTSGKAFTVKYSTSAPTDATTSWHGLYLGSSHAGTTQVISATAQ